AWDRACLHPGTLLPGEPGTSVRPLLGAPRWQLCPRVAAARARSSLTPCPSHTRRRHAGRTRMPRDRTAAASPCIVKPRSRVVSLQHIPRNMILQRFLTGSLLCTRHLRALAAPLGLTAFLAAQAQQPLWTQQEVIA